MSATSDFLNSEAGQAVIKAGTQIATTWVNNEITSGTIPNTGINPYATGGGVNQTLGSLGGGSGSGFRSGDVPIWAWIVGAVAVVALAFAFLKKKR